MAKKELVPLQDILERLDELHYSLVSAADEVQELQDELRKYEFMPRLEKVYRETFDGIRQLMKDRQWTKYVADDSCDEGFYRGCMYIIKTDKYNVWIMLENYVETSGIYAWYFTIGLCVCDDRDDSQRQRKNLQLLADKIQTESNIELNKDFRAFENCITVKITEDKDILPTIEKVFTIMFE